MWLGFLAVVWITILGLTTDALAIAVTLRKPISTGGSIVCDIEATGIGSMKQSPKGLTCQLAPLPGETGQAGLVVCGNPGKKLNTSPGIQVAIFEGSFDEFEPIDPRNCDRNGKCNQVLHAELTGPQLGTLNSACPNQTNWSALDFVPCTTTASVEVFGLDCTGATVVLAQATYECTLPNCDTLTWNRDTQNFETREYICRIISQQDFQVCK